MGRYLNVTTKGFKESIQSEIYVDKTDILKYLNRVIDTEQKYICISRPRRFGKSMTLKMLSAYYNCEADSSVLFQGFNISKDADYERHRNRYDVVLANMQDFWDSSLDMDRMLAAMTEKVGYELRKKYKDVDYTNAASLVDIMYDIFYAEGRTFILLIDEWDCVFREQRVGEEAQKKYLDFLRSWMKDKPYIGLAYMTGILPIKKYGTHSALNMFTEYSMTNQKQMARYTGFTGEEVRQLCGRYQVSFEEVKAWYDGYSFGTSASVYSPKSVVDCLTGGVFDNYWNQTETFEALKIYIQMNYGSLKDKVVKMIAGGRVKINVGSFSNDMKTFHCADDVLTLLIHLGYLAYDFERKEVYIPNKEVGNEFMNAIQVIGWKGVIDSVEASHKLLDSLWEGDEKAVAEGIEKVHQENTSVLQYNDENSLSCTISLALYSAKEYYMVIREMPAGKGYADLIYLPRKKYADRPAMVVELKWNMDADGALAQIHRKEYPAALLGYSGSVMLVGINYDKAAKKHTCRIETITVRT